MGDGIRAACRATATRGKAVRFITCDLRGVKKPGRRRRARCSRNSQISNQFGPPIFLTLSESGPILMPMTNRRRFAAALLLVAAARSSPATLARAGHPALAVRQRRWTTRARRSPTSASRLHRPRRQGRARGPAGSRRPPSRCRWPSSSTTARPRATTSRDIRTGCRLRHRDDQPARKNEVSIIALAERPTVLAGYTLNQTELTEGRRPHLRAGAGGSYLLDGIIEVSKGFAKRERAAAGHRRHHDRRAGVEQSPLR